MLADGELYNRVGKLELASGNIDRSTGSISTKATFDNPNRLIRSGGSARVIITNTLKNVIRIPMSAVKDIQDKYFIFKIDKENKVKMTPVIIAGNSGTDFLVKDGLETGERIALNNIESLSDGLEVAIDKQR